MIVQRHIESSEDFPIAVLHHRWGRYVMDDRSGLFTKFHGKAASIDGESVVAAWSTFDKSWAVFRRLSDDETEKLIDEVIDRENLPF